MFKPEAEHLLLNMFIEYVVGKGPRTLSVAPKCSAVLVTHTQRHKRENFSLVHYLIIPSGFPSNPLNLKPTDMKVKASE